MRQQITARQALQRFLDGKPIKMMVSENKKFETMRPVDANKYLTLLLMSDDMMFFVEDEKTEPVTKKRVNVPGDRPFDRLCREQDRTGDFSDDTIKKIAATIEIYEEEEED